MDSQAGQSAPRLSGAPRLQESHEAPGGSAAGSLPASAYHPSNMQNTELGVYVKWALLLQEQLEHVQAERTAVLQRCLKLQADNQLLRQTLQEENPAKYAHLAPANAQPSQAVSAQAARGEAGARRSAMLDSSIASGSQAGGEMSPNLGSDMLSTPNLRLLAHFLKEEGGDHASPGQSSAMSTHRRATGPGEELDLPPLVAEGSGDMGQPPPPKLQRRSHAGRAVSAFNALAAASARKAARCEGP